MFERSEDHEILHRLLITIEPGEIVTYRDMKEAVGREITSTSGILRSVLNRLLNDDGIVFGNIRLVGYRRLTAEQTVDAADGDRGRLRRHARRNARRLVTADADFVNLDERHRLSYAVGLSLFQAITAATSRHAVKQLEASVRRTDLRPLPFADTLAAFVESKR